MPIDEAPPPPTTLYRIGRTSDPQPLALPPWKYVGDERFDDPERVFRVLYTGERRACFLESLAHLRADLGELSQRLDEVRGGNGVLDHVRSRILAALRRDNTGINGPRTRRIPPEWFQDRYLASLHVEPGQRWLDYRSAATQETLRRVLAAQLRDWRYEDFGGSEALNQDRRVSRAFSRWGYEQGYHGIVYACRHEVSRECWAIFDRAAVQLGQVWEIAKDDADLVAVTGTWNIEIS